MKINVAQLKTQLARGLSSFYVVSGDEPFQKQQAIKLIRKAAYDNGFIEQSRMINESGFNWGDLYNQLCSPSLFSSKQLIELDLRKTLPNKEAGEILKSCCDQPSADNIIVFNLPKIDSKISKSAWYKAIEKKALLIPVWPIDNSQLPQWIRQRSQSYGMSISANAATLLADYTEGSLSQAAQAIEKIYLINGKKDVDVDLVQQAISDQGQFSVFDFSEACIAGNKKRASKILKQLQAEGSEPSIILWSLTRELRMLADMATSLLQQQNFDALCKKHRVFYKRQQSVRQFLKKNKLSDCHNLLVQAGKIDRMIKGSEPGNVWQEIEMFCLRVQS